MVALTVYAGLLIFAFYVHCDPFKSNVSNILTVLGIVALM